MTWPYKVQLVQELKKIEHSMSFRFAMWVCCRLIEDGDFGKKNHIFILAFGAQKTRTHTLKSRRPQNESLFGVDFDPDVEHFSPKISKKRLL